MPGGAGFVGGASRAGRFGETPGGVARPAGGAEFVGALFGTLGLGAVVVMVNPERSSRDLAALVDYSRAGCLVVDRQLLAGFEEALALAGRRPPLLVVGCRAAGHASFGQQAGGPPLGRKAAPTHPDDPAIWLFSGGTTGLPKCMVHGVGQSGRTLTMDMIAVPSEK